MDWMLFFGMLPLVSLLFAVAWLVQRLINDAGLVDVLWSTSLALLTVIYALLGDGDALRRGLIAVMIGFWGFRLGGFVLITRVLKGEEDGRYGDMRRDWGRRFQAWMFLFYQLQALAAWGLSVVAFLIVQDQRSFGSSLLDWLGLAVFVGGLALEFTADAQMSRARSLPGRDRQQVIRTGLWGWSRHPNYFGEWCTWLGYALIVTAAQLPSGAPSLLWLLGWLPAVIMLLVILFGTGLPPNEQRNLASRRSAYQRYQNEVSAFLPWPPGWTPGWLKRPRIAAPHS